MRQSIILLSLKESLISIYKHKSIFAILVFLELAFIVSLGVVQFKYQFEIIDNSREILEYYQQLNLEEDSLGNSITEGKDILGSDPLLIYRKFKELVSLTIILVLSTVGIILFFNSLNWSLTELIFSKMDSKGFFGHFWKVLLINFIYLLGISIVLFLIFQKFYLNMISQSPIYLIIGLTHISLILYFMLISFSLSNYTMGKRIIKGISLGLKKAHYLLSIYILIIAFLAGMGLLLLLLQNQHIALLLFAVIVFVASFIIFRIFLITLIRKLDDRY